MLKKAFCLSIIATICLLADSVKYIAHRGDYVDAPEGTAPAYRLAVERHYDIMKMDIQKTKDGVIVMSHDGTLKRTMGWDVKIKDVTYDEIKQHGPFKPVGDYKDERIVTFKEAIAIAKALPEIWIDAKHFDAEFMEEVLKQAKRGVLSVIGDNGWPYGIWLNPHYRKEDGRIYFHGAKEGHKIDALCKDDRVSFTVIDDGVRDQGGWAYTF